MSATALQFAVGIVTGALAGLALGYIVHLIRRLLASIDATFEAYADEVRAYREEQRDLLEGERPW